MTDKHEIRLEFPPRYSAVDQFVEQIEAALDPPPRDFEIHVGLVEAMSNAIVHGALGIASTARNEGRIEEFLDQIEAAEAAAAERGCRAVQVRVRRASADGTWVEIYDGGRGFDWRATVPSQGRGIWILRRVFSVVLWNDEGNCARLLIGSSAST